MSFRWLHAPCQPVRFTAQLRAFRSPAALCAAGLFAALGPVQVLGAARHLRRFCTILLALGVWLVVRATGKISELAFSAAGTALAVAAATKYATALWIPVVIILAGSRPPEEVDGGQLSAACASA